jgi:hypothetical protein
VDRSKNFFCKTGEAQTYPVKQGMAAMLFSTRNVMKNRIPVNVRFTLSRRGRLRSKSAGSGKALWRFATGCRLLARPAPAGGNISPQSFTMSYLARRRSFDRWSHFRRLFGPGLTVWLLGTVLATAFTSASS